MCPPTKPTPHRAERMPEYRKADGPQVSPSECACSGLPSRETDGLTQAQAQAIPDFLTDAWSICPMISAPEVMGK